MQRFAAAQARQHHVEIPGAATQRRVVGHRQIGEGELVHAPRETLQRAQRQAKHLFESKQHLDDRVGVDAWPAALGGTGTGVALPQVLLHPDRHVASRDQPSVVGRPVLNSILALGLLPLLFVLAHRFRQKTRIYASSSKVNSPAAPAVARKRQPWLPQDLCNNAVERAKIRLTVQRLSRGQCRHDRQRSSAPFPERLPRRADFAVPNFTCPYPVLRSENTVLITPFRRPKNCCVADLSATAAKTCAPRKSLTHSVIAASLGS